METALAHHLERCNISRETDDDMMRAFKDSHDVKKTIDMDSDYVPISTPEAVKSTESSDPMACMEDDWSFFATSSKKKKKDKKTSSKHLWDGDSNTGIRDDRMANDMESCLVPKTTQDSQQPPSESARPAIVVMQCFGCLRSECITFANSTVAAELVNGVKDCQTALLMTMCPKCDSSSPGPAEKSDWCFGQEPAKSSWPSWSPINSDLLKDGKAYKAAQMIGGGHVYIASKDGRTTYMKSRYVMEKLTAEDVVVSLDLAQLGHDCQAIKLPFMRQGLV